MPTDSQPKLLVALILAFVFFGISDLTTLFWFPDFGQTVFKLINFYFIAILALLILAEHQEILVPKLSLLGVSANFAIFFIPFYLLFLLIFTGTVNVEALPVITGLTFTRELITSISENYIAFVLLPVIIPWGSGGNTIASRVFFKVRGYPIGYDIPDLNRIKQGIPSIFFITLLHTGIYSRNVSTFNEFYLALIIVFVMFMTFWLTKLTFGFGSSEAGHGTWNMLLSTVRGSII